MTTRIGILGGTFDPIHCGHIEIGIAAEQALRLSQVLVMPASIPPHRSHPVASPFHRFAMTAIAVADRPGWQASDLELRREAVSYTSATLQRLHEAGYAAAQLVFIVGADAFADVSSWKDYPAIFDQAHFAVVSRSGWPVTDFPERFPDLSPRMKQTVDDETRWTQPLIFLIDAMTSDVSSTAIRQRRAGGQSITGLVAAGVERHIEQHGLYSVFQERTAGGLHGKD